MINLYLAEAIRIETNMSKLYTKFSAINNYEFWLSLSLEEIRHANVLQNILYALSINKENTHDDFDISKESIDSLILMNEKIESLINKEIQSEDLFNIAMELESSASESHFQKLTKTNIDNIIVKTFIELSKDDVDHYNRIFQQSKKQV